MMKRLSIKNWWLFGNHYRYAILIAWAFECPCYFFAQNMVPNSSFEDTLSCPTSPNQFSLVKNWFEPYQCSVDYFNVCSNSITDVPENYSGFQYADDGSGYIGLIVYSALSSMPNFREYAEAKLNSPMLQGKKYCINFYVSLTVKDGPALNYAINTLGCLLTEDSLLLDSCDQEIFIEPQIENNQGIITDTMNWVLISGEFTANGGEQFLTIGNFRNDSNTSAILIDSTTLNSYFAYYYIDYVSIVLCDTTAVEELQITDYRLQIYPNPASGSVTITAEGGDEIRIFDVAGRTIKTIKHFKNSINISTGEIENGIYFISLYKNNSITNVQKLIKTE